MYFTIEENALDHFLQVLFALNKTFFPSRKRSLQFIDRFDLKPTDCSEKLLEIVRLAGKAGGMKESYLLWSNLVDELQRIVA